MKECSCDWQPDQTVITKWDQESESLICLSCKGSISLEEKKGPIKVVEDPDGPTDKVVFKPGHFAAALHCDQCDHLSFWAGGKKKLERFVSGVREDEDPFINCPNCETWLKVPEEWRVMFK